MFDTNMVSLNMNVFDRKQTTKREDKILRYRLLRITYFKKKNLANILGGNDSRKISYVYFNLN